MCLYFASIRQKKIELFTLIIIIYTNKKYSTTVIHHHTTLQSTMASIAYKQITSIEEAYDAFHTTIDANFTAVKQEYHKLALLNHPDKNGGHDFAFFQHISFAFQVIHSRHEKEMRKLVKHDTKRKHAGENRDNTNSSHNESQASESNERWEESQAADKKK